MGNCQTVGICNLIGRNKHLRRVIELYRVEETFNRLIMQPTNTVRDHSDPKNLKGQTHCMKVV